MPLGKLLLADPRIPARLTGAKASQRRLIPVPVTVVNRRWADTHSARSGGGAGLPRPGWHRLGKRAAMLRDRPVQAGELEDLRDERVGELERGPPLAADAELHGAAGGRTLHGRKERAAGPGEER